MNDNDMSYNGWRNYPTWVASMLLDGNYGEDGQGTYLQVQRVIANAVRASRDTFGWQVLGERRATATSFVADALREWAEEHISVNMLHQQSGATSDLLQWALDMIDWREIAKAHVDAITLIDREE